MGRDVDVMDDCVRAGKLGELFLLEVVAATADTADKAWTGLLVLLLCDIEPPLETACSRDIGVGCLVIGAAAISMGRFCWCCIMAELPGDDMLEWMEDFPTCNTCGCCRY